jgi:hypothetical protein
VKFFQGFPKTRIFAKIGEKEEAKRIIRGTDHRYGSEKIPEISSQGVGSVPNFQDTIL